MSDEAGEVDVPVPSADDQRAQELNELKEGLQQELEEERKQLKDVSVDAAGEVDASTPPAGDKPAAEEGAERKDEVTAEAVGAPPVEVSKPKAGFFGDLTKPSPSKASTEVSEPLLVRRLHRSRFAAVGW